MVALHSRVVREEVHADRVEQEFEISHIQVSVYCAF